MLERPREIKLPRSLAHSLVVRSRVGNPPHVPCPLAPSNPHLSSSLPDKVSVHAIYQTPHIHNTNVFCIHVIRYLRLAISSLKSREHDPRQLRVPCIAHHKHTRDLHTTASHTRHSRSSITATCLSSMTALPDQMSRTSVKHAGCYFCTGASSIIGLRNHTEDILRYPYPLSRHRQHSGPSRP